MRKSTCRILLVGLAYTLAVWAGQEAGYENPACGGKSVIVHLFEWKWTDIALECERFLASAGFCGVQVSPPNEHTLITTDYPYPWWQRYQPVSYKLHSRSGTEEEFVDMVRRCNAAGVRIFVDAVINHMAGIGRHGEGSAGSSFDSDARDFPAVPYEVDNFTPRDLCPSMSGTVDNYTDPYNVRNCYLLGLTDLYGATDYVRQTVAAYFNKLVDIGVAGFRVDASKHMWPEDLRAILELTHDLNTEQGFPAGTRPFFAHEVIDLGNGAVTPKEYYGLGRVTEFKYSQKIALGVQEFDQLKNVYEPGSGMVDPDKAFVFVDNHDNQRGHGGAGDTLTHKWPHEYRLGVAFTLAQPYGFTRIMSSYYFGDDSDAGPPHYSDYCTADVIINSENQCEGGWVCEHRWLSIYKMVRFRNAVAAADSWDDYYCDGNVVAFSRGDKGFFVMVRNGTISKQTFQTRMPPGNYEDIVACQSVTVSSDGQVQMSVASAEEPVFAICQGCVCSEQNEVTWISRPDTTAQATPPEHTAPSVTRGVHRTVVFIEKQTFENQDLFLRGGLDADKRPGCTDDVIMGPCAIDMESNSLGETDHYNKYNSWRVGDTRLDWLGAEPGQGTYQGQAAFGSPMAWTSNQPGSQGFQKLNGWGEHYWMIDVKMNCSQTEKGWFEIKAFMESWEEDIEQVSVCSGTAGGSTPYASKNHVGRCGYINVFIFGSPSCVVYTF